MVRVYAEKSINFMVLTVRKNPCFYGSRICGNALTLLRNVTLRVRCHSRHVRTVGNQP
nr:MAG TPA: hypothetical protein [Caudoviricetes sp.]